MNIPAAIEQALAKLLRDFSELGDKVQVRVWQALATDGSTDTAGLREYPLVDVRASPPSVDENQRTLRCPVTVIAATKDGDDPQHMVISAMYDAIQGTLDRLFSQWVASQGGAPDGAEYTAFTAALADLLKDADFTFNFGGFSFGDGLSPRNENGANMIGTTLIVHFGRSDF